MKLMNNKEAQRQQQQQVIEQNMSPGRKPVAPEKKKEINVKVTKDVHRQLRKWGDVSENYGDVIEKILDYWEDHHEIRIKEKPWAGIPTLVSAFEPATSTLPR
jgi:hypothetical protein